MLETKVKVEEMLPSDPWTEERERVILIHGLFLYGWVMRPIGRFLMEKDYSPLLYDYPTMRYTVADHGERLGGFLQKFFREAEENSYRKRFHFVTHSMGGLILRKALQLLEDAEKEKVGNIVMIAPPNRGSDVARDSLRFLPFPARYIKPLTGLSSCPDSFANQEKMPGVFRERIGIVGAENDLMVKKEYTFLDVSKERIFLPGHHTPVLFRKDTANAVLSFLQKGSFPEEMERK